MSRYFWRPYVSVAERKAKALKKMQKLRDKGKEIYPVDIEGEKIATSFWGKAWCDHLESFSDFENRLPRGRTYVRNGSVCHLEILPGKINAIVSGSELYNISISIEPLKENVWQAIKKQCSGKIGSMLELLQGRLSDSIMGIVTHAKKGLLPLPGQIDLKCNCPDWATMCKHVAAVLYGIGNRLDSQPELLFILRGVDASELISGDLDMTISQTGSAKTIANDELAGIFGADIDLDLADQTKPTRKRKKRVGNSEKTIKTKKKADVTEKLPRLRPTGKSVARIRKKLKLSVTKFANQLEVSSTSIYKWEKTPGKLKLKDKTLEKLASLQQSINR
ncbi:MAG: hypothetical protein JEZ07_10140 [Phycisphaerae bacterium]|nr:hypothetical protein [Phycisphaerae bacterium]